MPVDYSENFGRTLVPNRLILIMHYFVSRRVRDDHSFYIIFIHYNFYELCSHNSYHALSVNCNTLTFHKGNTNCLYPNPSSRSAHGSISVVMFEFLGRILGKALYEGITIQPQFAHFFLSFLRGEYNFLHMLPDLTTLDSTL